MYTHPINEKSLFHFLCEAMHKVEKEEITPAQVHSICELAKEAEKLGEWWVLIIAAAAGISCWLLGRLWDRRGKLPDEVLNRNNDRA